MVFKRTTVACELPRGESLTRALAGIGMAFAMEPDAGANMEDALLAASIEGLEFDDLRVLAVLTTWIEVHHPWVNVDRLTRAISSTESPRVRAYWAAVASWLSKDCRFRRIAQYHSGDRVDLLRVGTEFQLRRCGEDERLVGTCFRVPANVLRRSPSNILSPTEVAKLHRTYRWRVLMGPSYRADMWAALEETPTLSASDLARVAYGSFATAWHVKKDFELLTT